MKISSINSTLNANATRNNKQTFKGLWGETSYRNDMDPVMFIMKQKKTVYYYPFADESNEKCAAIRQANRGANIVGVGRESQYQINECKICQRLPFTESQYEAYKKAGEETKLSQDLIEIHRELKDKYTDNCIVNQTSASNPIIKKKIENALYSF